MTDDLPERVRPSERLDDRGFAVGLVVVSASALFGWVQGGTLGTSSLVARSAVLVLSLSTVYALRHVRAAAATAAASHDKSMAELATLASSGGGAVESITRTEAEFAGSAELVSETTHASTNTIILLGMTATAAFLALQAPQFVAAESALSGSDVESLKRVVAALLGLGPKAFLSTAIAVIGAIIVSLVGAGYVSQLRGRRPATADLLATWSRGRESWGAAEEARQGARDRALLDVALSNQSVRELNDALHRAAATFSGLEATVQGFKEAATRIVEAQKVLDTLVTSFEKADKRAESVATALGQLAEDVRDYSKSMLKNSEEYGHALMKMTGENSARLVAEGLEKTLSVLQPEFSRLAQDLHSRMADSAQFVSTRATSEFTGAVQDTLGQLRAVDGAVTGFSGHLREIVSNLRRWTTEIDQQGAALQAALATVGNGLDPSGRTLPSVQAFERARGMLDQSAEQLAKAAERMAVGMDAVRRNAELLGQVREAVRQADSDA